MVKELRRSCKYCLLQRVRPVTQLTGELPEGRLAIELPPFSHVACDYFGPFKVELARNRTCKRWGALFTCTTTRAVYLDLAVSLSSEDFLLVFRRFIGLYGRPKAVYSDNGTNFVGAKRELREAVDSLHGSVEVETALRSEGTKWYFQPARTPHFEGAHEALVRSTKKALYASLKVEKQKHRSPSEEILTTLLLEVATAAIRRRSAQIPKIYGPLYLTISSTGHQQPTCRPGSFIMHSLGIISNIPSG